MTKPKCVLSTIDSVKTHQPPLTLSRLRPRETHPWRRMLYLIMLLSEGREAMKRALHPSIHPHTHITQTPGDTRVVVVAAIADRLRCVKDFHPSNANTMMMFGKSAAASMSLSLYVPHRMHTFMGFTSTWRVHIMRHILPSVCHPYIYRVHT